MRTYLASRDAVQGSPHFFLADGSHTHNPGIAIHQVGEPGAGFLVLDFDDPTVYDELVRRAAGVVGLFTIAGQPLSPSDDPSLRWSVRRQQRQPGVAATTGAATLLLTRVMPELDDERDEAGRLVRQAHTGVVLRASDPLTVAGDRKWTVRRKSQVHASTVLTHPMMSPDSDPR